jgi:carboxypeptidase family protein
MQTISYAHSITVPIAISAVATRVRSLIILAVVCAATMAAHAQYNGSIRGNVTDSTGALIPGATVTLTNTDTGRQLVSTSSDDGIYNFNAFPRRISPSQWKKMALRRRCSRRCRSSLSS